MDSVLDNWRSPGRIPGLDGLRAVSIALVVVSHAGLQNLVPGIFGVTVFFFISGFLITTLLLREYDSNRKIALGSFYARRMIRLYPPLVVYILVSALIWFLKGNTPDPLGVLAAFAYFANYIQIYRPEAMDGLGGQLWSLAVEEHFYAFFPLLLLVLLPRRTLILKVLAMLCLLALAFRYHGYFAYPGIGEAYTQWATQCKIDAILFGAMTAFVWCSPGGRDFVYRITHPAIVATALAALLFSFLYRDETFRATLRFTVQQFALVPLVLAATVSPRRYPFRAILDSRPFVHIGELSYSLYLWHLPGLAAGSALFPGSGMNAVIAALVGGLVSYALAWLSYNFLEKRFFALRRRFGSHVEDEHKPATAAQGDRAASSGL